MHPEINNLVHTNSSLIRNIGASTLCGLFAFTISPIAHANTLCVNQHGTHGCYAKIQSAVNHASPNDVIDVRPGTYTEQVTIGFPLALIGAGADDAIIDATGLPNGILVDGLSHPGLRNVTIAGFTVENALYEGVLLVSAEDVTVRDNHIVNNDKYGPNFTFTPSPCPGQPAFETDESGDCGGGLHLIGTSDSIMSRNLLSGNGDGILISDETAASRGNLISHNIVKDNALECGIVLASHPPVGSSGPHYAPHHGIDHNTVADNISMDNGVKVGGSGVGLFSDGAGPGRVSNTVIIRNRLTGNGLGGVALHSHAGPAFGAPADNFDGNMIIGNYIAGNLADQADTATPGRVGININSGGGGSPVRGTVITQNVIRDEDVDVAVNTPAEVDVHLNDLLGEGIGVANVCALDNGSGSPVCTGNIDATQNFWGCPTGPEGNRCTTTNGKNVRFTPWLENAIGEDNDRDR